MTEIDPFVAALVRPRREPPPRRLCRELDERDLCAQGQEGETTDDLFGFLTTEPNDVVAPIHAKAMPVILTKPEEIETWMTAPAGEALKLTTPWRSSPAA
jgi:putative SOS response-associated peptidase YedK